MDTWCLGREVVSGLAICLQCVLSVASTKVTTDHHHQQHCHHHHASTTHLVNTEQLEDLRRVTADLCLHLQANKWLSSC